MASLAKRLWFIKKAFEVGTVTRKYPYVKVEVPEGSRGRPVIDFEKCIGCGACVAACKNASTMLFVSAKVSQFALLPQGKIEAKDRVKTMVAKMDELGFGNCTNTYACEAECPKEISVANIARMNREFLKAKLG